MVLLLTKGFLVIAVVLLAVGTGRHSLPVATVAAQEGDEHSPANLTGVEVGSAEIALLWSEPIGSPNPDWHSSQKVYSYLRLEDSEIGLIRHPDEKCPPLENPEAECTLEPGEHDGTVVAEQANLFGDHSVALVAADLNGDGVDDLVGAWEGPERRVTLAVPQNLDGNLDWSEATEISTAINALPDTNFEDARVHLAAGDVDGDGLAEVVLAYRSADELLTIEIYDGDGSLTLQRRATSALIGDSDALPTGLPGNAEEYGIATGDVDGDGSDEIVLVSTESHTPEPGAADQGQWGLYVAVYDVTGEGSTTMSRQARLSTYPNPAYEAATVLPRQSNSRANGVAVVTGDFDGDDIDEIVYGYGVTRLVNFPYDRSFMHGVWFDANGSLVAGARVQNSQFVGDIYLAAGDIDADVTRDAQCGTDGEPFGKLRDEIVTAVDGDSLDIYCGYPLVQPPPAATGSATLAARTRVAAGVATSTGSTRQLALADVNQDGRDDLIEAVNVQYSGGSEIRQELKITVYSTTPNESTLWNFQEVATRRDRATRLPRDRSVALAAGDFDGKSFRFGEAVRYRQTDVVQPIVILKAPPIHFDVLGDSVYDISECYGGGDCGFRATYSQGTTRTTIGTTTLNSDWKVDRGLNVDLGVEDVSILQGYMKESFGESFSNSASTGNTYDIVLTETASRDDRLFALVVDYDIWEYPVYRGDPTTPVGHIVVVEPGLAQPRWFPSKSPTANEYRPRHETGNLFSYPDYRTPADNPDRKSGVIFDSATAGFEVGPDSVPGEKWRLTFTKFGESNVSTTESSALSLGGSAGLFFLNGDIDDTESEARLSTSSTSVSEEIEIAIELGKTTPSPVGTFYAVTPYAYWAQSGALVIDYLVNPAQDDRGGQTWWQREYDSKPDPALILPWRYETEKAGQALEGFEEVQRTRTKDITLTPLRPNPGEPVRLEAHIHNYSFDPTSTANNVVPVTVAFYLGDPDHGGVLIAEGSTDGNLAGRGKETVTANWVVPADADWRYARIYAVIDPAGTIDEIHESNNKGWTILDFTCAECTAPDLSIADSDVQLFRLADNFVRIQARIQAEGAGSAGISVEFYNGNPAQNGRKIGETVMDKIKRKGTYLVDETVRFVNPEGRLAAQQDQVWVRIATQGPEDSNTLNNLASSIVPGAESGAVELYLPLMMR